MSKIKFIGKSFRVVKSISNEQKCFDLLVGQCADTSVKALVDKYKFLITQDNFELANKFHCPLTLRMMVANNLDLNTIENLKITLRTFDKRVVASIFNPQNSPSLFVEKRGEEKIWQGEEMYLRFLRAESEDLIEVLGRSHTENIDSGEIDPD
jgi:hypothetical protein